MFNLQTSSCKGNKQTKNLFYRSISRALGGNANMVGKEVCTLCLSSCVYCIAGSCGSQARTSSLQRGLLPSALRYPVPAPFTTHFGASSTTAVTCAPWQNRSAVTHPAPRSLGSSGSFASIQSSLFTYSSCPLKFYSEHDLRSPGKGIGWIFWPPLCVPGCCQHQDSHSCLCKPQWQDLNQSGSSFSTRLTCTDPICAFSPGAVA